MTLPPMTPSRPATRTTAPTTARTPARVTVRLAVALGLAAGACLVPAAAGATPWPGHADRTLVRHTVQPGETATSLAVRYHAWTDELVRLNRLGPSGAVYRGQVLRIPVVTSVVRRAHGQATTSPAHRPIHHRAHHVPPLLVHSLTPRPRGWLHADLSRDQVRALVSRMATRYHVPRTLALAVAWQESGWQQRRVSAVGALGVMQVLPDTGRWMRWYAGRPLRLRDTHDNIEAGVLTLRTLRSWTRQDNTAIAAYYQGLGAVRKHGFFRDTKRYVRSVRAIQRNIIRSGNPV